jgi:hybrid cluster-associated redox disulfide protein
VESLTPSLPIATLLERWPPAAQVLIARRMACVGCDMNRFDSIADAAAAYGLSETELMRDLRRAIEGVPADPAPVDLEGAAETERIDDR